MLRRSDERVLLIPNQWDGSVQHFYHFLLGYLMPVTLRIHRKKLKRVTVRDCGPMNRWFGPLESLVDIQIMNVGHVLHSFAGKLQPSVVLPSSDNPERFGTRDIREFTELYLELALPPRKIDLTERVTILERRLSDPYFDSLETEARGSGAERRSIPNLAQIVASIEGHERMTLFDASEVDLVSQLAQFAGSSTLVGQHGAGLANMIWLPKGGQVLEVMPPRPAHTINIFRNLARACGHDYEMVSQDSDHAPVDRVQFAMALDSFLRER